VDVLSYLTQPPGLSKICACKPVIESPPPSTSHGKQPEVEFLIVLQRAHRAFSEPNRKWGESDLDQGFETWWGVQKFQCWEMANISVRSDALCGELLIKARDSQTRILMRCQTCSVLTVRRYCSCCHFTMCERWARLCWFAGEVLRTFITGRHSQLFIIALRFGHVAGKVLGGEERISRTPLA
jgi:hypothetical protein